MPKERSDALDRLCESLGLMVDTIAPTMRFRPDKITALKGDTDLVPGLTRALSESPDWESEKAAAVLAVIGLPAAESAVPQMAAALARHGGIGDFVYRENLAASLTQISGGPSGLADSIHSCLTNRDPNVRRCAAKLFEHQSDFETHSVVRHADGSYTRPTQDIAVRKAFGDARVALAETAVLDPDETVRLAALDALAHNFYKVSWDRILSRLASTYPGRTIQDRRGILRVFGEADAVTPASIAVIRQALLDTDPETADNALDAFSNAIAVDGNSVQAALLSDLASPVTGKRTLAARRIEIALYDLWGYGSPIPAARRVFVARRESQVPEQHHGTRLRVYSPAAEIAKSGRRARLIVALTAALNDREKSVRLSSGRSLEKIGNALDRYLYRGDRSALDTNDAPAVLSALRRAQTSLAVDDPRLCARLQALISKILTPHPTA